MSAIMLNGAILKRHIANQTFEVIFFWSPLIKASRDRRNVLQSQVLSCCLSVYRSYSTLTILYKIFFFVTKVIFRVGQLFRCCQIGIKIFFKSSLFNVRQSICSQKNWGKICILRPGNQFIRLPNVPLKNIKSLQFYVLNWYSKQSSKMGYWVWRNRQFANNIVLSIGISIFLSYIYRSFRAILFEYT